MSETNDCVAAHTAAEQARAYALRVLAEDDVPIDEQLVAQVHWLAAETRAARLDAAAVGQRPPRRFGPNDHALGVQRMP